MQEPPHFCSVLAHQAKTPLAMTVWPGLGACRINPDTKVVIRTKFLKLYVGFGSHPSLH